SRPRTRPGGRQTPRHCLKSASVLGRRCSEQVVRQGRGMKKVVGLVAAAVVVLGIVTFASERVIGGDRASASATPAVAAQGTAAASAKGAASVKVATSTKTYSLTAGGLKRSYEVIAPVTALPKSAPVIVMLSGIRSTVAQEISRDRLVNYAAADQAEIVYPVAFDESWNAIGCCGKAAAEKVN